jgi:hypothetical protein
MGSGDVASGENRASTSVAADDDGVFGCRFLHKGIVYGVAQLHNRVNPTAN